jgi:membrane protease subunit HflC
MNRSLPSIVAGVGLLIALVLYMVTFQVRFNEVALVRTFGKITVPDPDTGVSPDVKTEPGLYWKWPWPVQRVEFFDNRIHLSETVGEEIPTRDAKNIVLTTAVGWRIADPYLFSIKNTDEKDAENKLLDRVRNDQKAVIANYDFSHLISKDESELEHDQIEAEIEQKVSAGARRDYGIEVEFVGFENLALPQRITQNVFSAMREERIAEAARYTSQGESEAARIKAEAESIANTVLSFARARADDIIAEGKNRAAKYNEILGQDEGLAIFLEKMRYLGDILEERTTLVLDAEPPFDLLLDDSKKTRTSDQSASSTQPADASTSVALPELIQP